MRPLLSLLIVIAAALASSCQGAGPAGSVGALARDIALAAETTVVSARVASGATFASMLREQGMTAPEVAAVVARVAVVFDLRKVRAAQPYRLERAIGGAMRRIEYEIDGDRFLRVSREGDEWLATVLSIPKTRRIEIVRGTIDRSAPSLVAALDAAGETIDLTLALAEIFGGDIDFNTELQPGDRFELTVEKQYREAGAFAGYGPILAAAFNNAGRWLQAVRFAGTDGTPGYFDERGVSMHRFFLASPLKFQPVVTSGFSRSRFHPILREYRAHLGVDYRAPAGAPVIAIADGIVVSAGMSGGSGRMVHVRHANGFESEYLHLSSIAVRAGGRVRQGELIGRVGSTGLATGPHLDYRLKKNGAFINPLTAHRAMPPSDPVPAARMAEFNRVRDLALAAFSAPPVTRVSNPNATVQ
ncbi:MAG TPA: M23 family metallopeptidase [Vicinamibacterales bacterium]|nr:M23 family metallopeptidase [Vicinamibacterales bacterium]